jgi:glutathione S-transferase
MHAGFVQMRTAMPMNLKFKLKGKPASAEVQRDIERVIEIWEEARTQFATTDGPYLFGAFSVADAMFAPLVWRLHIYNVTLPPLAASYRDIMLAHPAMREWYADALLESEAHPHYDRLAEDYGGMR